MNNSTNISLTSSIFPENPYNTTGYRDKNIASPIETRISRIKVNFGLNCQNTLNFAARVLNSAAQNPNTHQKTTAIKARRGFTFCN